jgi:uncharacterized damage-inducible protein DinB
VIKEKEILMEIGTFFHAQAINNLWANYRLLSVCDLLTPEELNAPRTGYFPSIIKTLNHTLTVDWFYVSALEGGCIGHTAFEPEIPFSDVGDLHREQEIVDRRLIVVCDALGSKGFGAEISLIRDTGIQIEHAGRTLLHLFQHQIHHRGQVHAMLSGTSAAPPQLDEFFLGDPKEQALRKHDFAKLGLNESQIWCTP